MLFLLFANVYVTILPDRTHTCCILSNAAVNSHENISRELLWCGRRLLATHLVIGSIIVFFFAAIFHFGSEAGVEAAWFMVRECAESFSRQTSADVSVRRRWDDICASGYPPECVRGGGGKEAWTSWTSCGATCDHLLFLSEGALLVGAPVPAGSCLVLMANWSVQLCVQKYACTIWVEGWRGGGVGVNVAEAWACSQEQGAPRGMPWKNETEECRLHWAV